MHLADFGAASGPCRCRSPRSAHRRRELAALAIVGERGVELRDDGLDRAARLAHFEALADAQDDVQPAAQRRLGLGLDVGVALALRIAALGMADDGQARPGVEQHARRDAAGVGALLGLVDVLRPIGKPGTARAARSIRIAGTHKATSTCG